MSWRPSWYDAHRAQMHPDAEDCGRCALYLGLDPYPELCQHVVVVPHTWEAVQCGRTPHDGDDHAIVGGCVIRAGRPVPPTPPSNMAPERERHKLESRAVQRKHRFGQPGELEAAEGLQPLDRYY